MTSADDTLAGAQRGGTGGQTLPHPNESLPVPIFLPLPPSDNGLFRNAGRRDSVKHRIKTDAYTQWIVDAGTQLMMQRPKKHLGKVRLRLVYGFPDKRRRDIFNYRKTIEDLLVRHQVIQDDDTRFVRGGDLWLAEDLGEKFTGVRVTITPLEGA